MAASNDIPLRRRRWPYVVVGSALGVVVFAAVFDWNWLRGPIERRVTAAAGREFHIGNLDVDLGLRTRIRADDVTFANASWSKRPRMIELQRIVATIDLPALAHGKVE